MEGKLGGKEGPEGDKSADVIHQSDDRDSAASECEKSYIDATVAYTIATMEGPKKSANRKQIPISLRTSDSPSNTFITDLKLTDPNMVRKQVSLLVFYCLYLNVLSTSGTKPFLLFVIGEFSKEF